MRKLLDASSQRMIRILETFAIHEEWITLFDLSSAIGASERTVADDIANLQQRWGKSLHIEISRKNGVIMNNRNIASIGRVFTDLFNDSVALLWVKELLFNPNMPIDFYETKLFVSRSTLIRLMTRINHFLSDRGITIQCINNKYQLLGKDEQYLRDFSASFLLELYGFDLPNYDITIDLKVMGEIIMYPISQYLEPRELSWVLNDDITITYWLMFYIISLVRENQGYTVTSHYSVEKEIDTQKLAYLQVNFPHITLDNLRPIHQLLFNRFCGWDSASEKSLVSKETDAFFQRLFSVIPVTPNKNTQYLMGFMLKSLYLNKKYRPIKTSALFNRIYYFSLSLKQANGFLYKAVEDNLKPFSQNVHIDLCANVDDTLFWLCLICPEMSHYSQAKRALLITDFGMPHAKFLVNTLSSFFNTTYTDSLLIDITHPQYVLTSADVKGYDIIITTIPDLHLHHKKIFLINDYPSYTDFMEIYILLNSYDQLL
nr:helix-turn-helix domain-containing protein [uncultured Anaerosporobacter sp.]